MQILFIMGAKLLFKYRGRCEASDINQRTMGLTELLVIGVIAVGGVFGRLNCKCPLELFRFASLLIFTFQ